MQNLQREGKGEGEGGGPSEREEAEGGREAEREKMPRLIAVRRRLIGSIDSMRTQRSIVSLLVNPLRQPQRISLISSHLLG